LHKKKKTKDFKKWQRKMINPSSIRRNLWKGKEYEEFNSEKLKFNPQRGKDCDLKETGNFLSIPGAKFILLKNHIAKRQSPKQATAGLNRHFTFRTGIKMKRGTLPSPRFARSISGCSMD